MVDVRQSWPSDTFDAVAILAIDGEVEVEGTSGQDVVLEGETESERHGDLDARQVGQWLRVQPAGRPGEVKLRLRLPQHKIWVVDVAAARGEVSVRGVYARLQVALGKGDVEVRDSRGTFAVKAARGDVKIQGCIEAEVPARPEVPRPETAGAEAAEAFNRAWRHGPPPPPPPPFGPGRRPPDFTAGWDQGWAWFDHVEDWIGSMPWQEWRGWVQDWLVNAPWHEWMGAAWGEWGQYLGTDDQALSLYLAKGNVELGDSRAGACRAWIGKGDFRVRGGELAGLQVRLAKGDFASDARPAPGAAWSVDTRSGDVELTLAAETSARLDAATRHGEIRSDFPLVRVGRPGPEARHGGRMVGTAGTGENPAQVSLTTMHGDITIRRVGPVRQDWPRQEKPAGEARPVPGALQTQEENQPAAGGAPQRSAPEEPATAGPVAEPERPPAEEGAPAGDSRLAILESLRRGEITVEEASRLLDSLA